MNGWKNCGIFTLCNTTHRKKVGTPTLHDSMDETREYHAKWNKSGDKRQIPYDLTLTGT